MKNLYFFIASFFLCAAVNAQCTIDGTNVPTPGVYPTAANLPHIQQGTFYDETVQGRIQSSGDTSVLGFTINIRVDSVRIDSITGRPAGINWAKNPNTLPGGGVGCIRFSGTTTAPTGTYPLTAWGTAYLYLSNTPAGAADGPRAVTGNLNQYSPFGGYYLTVDAGNTLSVTTSKTDVSCFGGNNGTATVTPTGGSNYTYAWSPNVGSGATVSNLTAGTYNVTVTSNGSTTATASVTITQPTQVTASGSATPSTGSNGTATVTPGGGTPGYTYVWNNTQTTATITGLAPATYTVTVTDSKGCTTTASATVNNGGNTLSVNITKTDITCFGAANGTATANASGSSGYTYSWSNSGNTATISNLSPGTYTVTVSASGSSVTASVTISQPSAFTATTGTTASSGSNGVATVTATGGTPPYTYSWSNSNTNDTVSGLAPGTYTVTVNDSRSCTVSASATVVVTGINDIEANYTLSIFPNPANDVVNVTAAIPAGEVNVRVLNLAGQVVYMARQNSSGNYKATINCDGFTAGVYVLELSAANQIARNRFVIAK